MVVAGRQIKEISIVVGTAAAVGVGMKVATRVALVAEVAVVLIPHCPFGGEIPSHRWRVAVKRVIVTAVTAVAVEAVIVLIAVIAVIMTAVSAAVRSRRWGRVCESGGERSGRCLTRNRHW